MKVIKKLLMGAFNRTYVRGRGKSLVVSALCALASLVAGSAWAEVNSYSEPDGKAYNFIFKGSSDADTGNSWNTLANWYTYSEDENGSPVWTVLDGTSVPGVNGDRWNYLLFDGNLLDESITAGEDGYREIASTSSGIEGWNMGFGFYNGVKVTVDKIDKLQNSSDGSYTASWVIDSTSKFVIKGWGSNGNYGTVNISIASEDGLEMKPRNHGQETFNILLSNGGTFKLTSKATGDNYNIGAVELLADDTHTGAGRRIYSKKIGTITSGTTVRFAFVEDATVTAPEGYTMVTQAAALTIVDPVGACTIRQDDEAVYLDYVDHAETVTPEFTISADTTWSTLVGDTAISDIAIVHVEADATLTFDQDPGAIVIYLAGDKKLTPEVASDVTVTSTINGEVYAGALQYSDVPTYSVTAANIDFDATAGLNITSDEWLTKIRTENKIFTFTGSGENGVTLDYGETHRAEGGVAFSSHIVFKGGTHMLHYRRENSGVKFAANATQDNPTIRVTDNATLTFKARNLCGWTSGNANTDGIIRVDSGSTLNYNPTNGTAYWAQQFYLEPGSTMNFTDDYNDRDNFRINGGTAQETAQIYVPACDADTENKTATIHCDGTGQLVINWQGTSGAAAFVGANSRLKLDTAVGGQDPIFKFYGSGEVEFTKTCTPKIIVDGTNKLILSADTTLNMSQINGECSVGGSGKVVSAVNPSRLTAADDWTGIVEISALNVGETSTSLNLAKIGNSNSKIIIKGITGTNVWPADVTKVDAEVQLDGALPFSNGSSNSDYKFAKISGSGNLSFNWNAGNTVTYTIDELNEYTGTLTSAKYPVTIGNIVKADAQAGDKLVATSTSGEGSFDIASTKVNGSAATLALADDGIYLATASCNGTGYTSLAAAVAAAEAEQTVTLLKDVTVDAELEIAKKITLDLNAKTITSTITTDSSKSVIRVATGGDVTITGNGTITGPTGADAAAMDGGSLIRVYGKLTLLNGTLTAGGEGADGMYGVYVAENGVAVFGDETQGPTITTMFAAVGANNTTSPVTITINNGIYTQTWDGTLNGEKSPYDYFCAAIYASATGIYTINGGTFDGGLYSIMSRYVNVNQTIAVNGGKFNDPLGVDEKTGTETGSETTRTITKASTVSLTAPEGYEWKNDTTLVKKSGAAIEIPDGKTEAEVVAGLKTDGEITILDADNVSLSGNVLTVGANTYTFAEYYDVAINGTKITVTLNDKAKPVIEGGTIGEETVEPIEVDASSVSIAVTSKVGLKYQLQKKTSLAADSTWADVTGEGASADGNGSTIQLKDPNKGADDTCGFYQISVTDK